MMLIRCLFPILIFSLSCLPIFGRQVATDTLTLRDGWCFWQEDKPAEKILATVPGVVQQDLIGQGILPDPNYRLGEDSVQWPEEHNWRYATAFRLTRRQLREHHQIDLLCEGLDTYADIFVNGEQVGESRNMFVPFKKNIRRYLRAGENKIELHFYSPLLKHRPDIERAGFVYPADNDHHEDKVSVYTRKAPYHFGWDWGMRLVTMGPWKPVRILLHGEASFAGGLETSYVIDEDYRQLTLHARVPLQVSRADRQYQLQFVLTGPAGTFTQERVCLLTGETASSDSVTWHDVPLNLWWPKGYGDQPIYQVEARLLTLDGRLLDRTMKELAFRRVELIREPDTWGRSFYFKINGKPIFMKGANYIPDAMLLATRTKESKQRLWQRIEEQHLNMIRIWGGGIYEDDEFYREATHRGILIWQDFMFSCTAYPTSPAFLEGVREEVSATVDRIGQHASVAAWCGNNEVKEGIRYWGWQQRFTGEQYASFWSDYHRLFREAIPQTLALVDKDRRPYIESSPDSANWGRSGSLAHGESHYWGVWYGREPFESLSRRIPRFMSEFGVQSMPDMPSIRRFAEPEDHYLESPVMRLHQKSTTGNEAIAQYIAYYYREPKDFADLCYLSQLMQGRGISYGIRAERAARPYCMGSLYWQLDDVWPALSWSAIDYYGRPKALHYEVSRAFAPQSLFVDTERFKPLTSPAEAVRLPNSTADPYPDSLYITLLHDAAAMQDLELKFSLVCIGKSKSAVKELSSIHLDLAEQENYKLALPMDKIIPKDQIFDSALLLRLLMADGTELTRYLYTYLPPKDIPELKSVAVQADLKQLNGDSWQLELSADRLVIGLAVEPTDGQQWAPSDNYYDLIPGECKTVVIESQERPRFIIRQANYEVQ